MSIFVAVGHNFYTLPIDTVNVVEYQILLIIYAGRIVELNLNRNYLRTQNCLTAPV